MIYFCYNELSRYNEIFLYITRRLLISIAYSAKQVTMERLVMILCVHVFIIISGLHKRKSCYFLLTITDI